jgi:hypothetical protein
MTIYLAVFESTSSLQSLKFALETQCHPERSEGSAVVFRRARLLDFVVRKKHEPLRSGRQLFG